MKQLFAVSSAMSEPDWALVLEKIYKEKLVWSKNAEYDDNHPVISAVDLDTEETQEALAFLYETEMVDSVHIGKASEISRPGKENLISVHKNTRGIGTHIGLSRKGFEVAHERETNQKRQRVNMGIGILTGILSFAAMVQAYSAYLSHQSVVDQSLLAMMMAVMGGISIAIMAIMIGRDPWEMARNYFSRS